MRRLSCGLSFLAVALASCDSKSSQYSTPEGYRVSIKISGSGVERLKQIKEQIERGGYESVVIDSGMSQQEEKDAEIAFRESILASFPLEQLDPTWFQTDVMEPAKRMQDDSVIAGVISSGNSQGSEVEELKSSNPSPGEPTSGGSSENSISPPGAAPVGSSKPPAIDPSPVIVSPPSALPVGTPTVEPVSPPSVAAPVATPSVPVTPPTVVAPVATPSVPVTPPTVVAPVEKSPTPTVVSKPVSESSFEVLLMKKKLLEMIIKMMNPIDKSNYLSNFVEGCAVATKVQKEKIVALGADSSVAADQVLLLIANGGQLRVPLQGRSIRGICVLATKGSEVIIDGNNTKVETLLSHESGLNNLITTTFSSEGRLNRAYSTFIGLAQSSHKVSLVNTKMSSCAEPNIIKVGIGSVSCE